MMQAGQFALPVSDYLEQFYLKRRFLSEGAALQLRIAVRLLDEYTQAVERLGRAALLSDLNPDMLCDWMRWLLPGRCPRTVNGKRGHIIAIWHAANCDGRASTGWLDVPKMPEYVRQPRAWTIEEMGRLLGAAREAESIQDWTSAHWQALILTCYDTAARIGAILQTERSQLDSTGLLTVKAENQKQRRDTVHRLHPQTLAMLDQLPSHKLLFPWPRSRRAIWPAFRSIVQAAGLPATRRDLFHKLRRTSYTWVAILAGKEAATQHAGHSRDMSRAYLDELLMPEHTPGIDVLPRF